MQKSNTTDESNKVEACFRLTTISPMTIDIVPQIAALEKMCFATPWSEGLFAAELENNNSYFLTVRLRDNLIGYAGFWLIIDEAHIVSLAVHPEFRRQKIGEMLVRKMLDMAKQKGAIRATLEVRETNTPANLLYEKFGFRCVALRKEYYSDTKEHAVIMWMDL